MGITRYYLNQIVDICREYEEAIESGEIRTDFDDNVEKMVRFERICEIVKYWRSPNHDSFYNSNRTED